MGVISKISLAVEHTLSSTFGRIGWELAARPYHFMLGLVLLAGILASGIPSIKSESEAEKLYIPSHTNRARDDLKRYEDLFRSVEGITAPNYIIAYVEEGGEENLLTPTVLNSLYELDQKIKALEATEGDKTVKLEDLCVLSTQAGFTDKCEFHGVTDLMQGPISDVQEIGLATPLTTDHQGASQVTPLFAGGRTVSADGTIEKVQAWRWTIILDSGRLPEEDLDLQEAWMRELLNLLIEEDEKLSQSSPYKLAYDVEFSQNEELDKSTNGDSSLLSITFTLVICFSYFISRSYSDMVLSKGNVIWGAMTGIILAIGSAFGIMGHCGVIFNPVVSTTSLLLLGLGVDDAYVIMQAWHNTAETMSPASTVQERMKRTYETAGVSVFFTSITDVLAFAIGCSSTFPAVRGFCAYTATGVLFLFVYQVLFFGAVMALDGHREYCGVNEWRAYLGKGWIHGDKYSPTKTLLDRLSPTDHIPVMPEIAAIQRITKRYADVLLKPATSAVVLVCFTGYLVYAIVGAMGVGAGLDVRDLAPSNSYWTVFVNQRFNYFNEKGPLYSVAFPADSIDWSVKAHRESSLQLASNLEALDCLEREERLFWLRELYKSNAAAEELEGGDFLAAVDTWVQTPAGSQFAKDVLIEATPGADGFQIIAARFSVRMEQFESTGGDTRGVPCMKDSQKVLDTWQEGRAEATPIISYEQFQFWESSAVIVEQTVLNLIYAAVGCFIITLIVLPHPIMCVLAMGVVAMILAGVVGTMSLILDINIETISMINLVLAIGFSIDNVAHMCHAYMFSKCSTRKEKALDALLHIGWPILAGDASTMIALLPLVGSKSQIFKSFFYILFTVLLLGALHAVVFLPVVLSWIGPLPDRPEDDIEMPAQDAPDSKPAGDVVHSRSASPQVASPEPPRIADPVIIETNVVQQ